MFIHQTMQHRQSHFQSTTPDRKPWSFLCHILCVTVILWHFPHISRADANANGGKPAEHLDKASSEEPFLEPEDYIHNGFYFRTEIGYIRTQIRSAENDNATSSFSGDGWIQEFQIGGAIDWNMILHINLGFINYSNVSGHIRTAKDQKSSIDKAEAYSSEFGFTYYIMPSNSYISFGISNVIDSFSYTEPASPTTGALNPQEEFLTSGIYLQIGREWWIHEEWGIGAGVMAFVRPSSSAWNTMIGLHISATFN